MYSQKRIKTNGNLEHNIIIKYLNNTILFIKLIFLITIKMTNIDMNDKNYKLFRNV